MPLTYQKTVENHTVVELERTNQLQEVLTEQKQLTPSPEVLEIVRHMSLSEIIN